MLVLFLLLCLCWVFHWLLIKHHHATSSYPRHDPTEPPAAPAHCSDAAAVQPDIDAPIR